jgi:glutamate synthase domain-containing protein 2/glutamate synthase domain-containing protein 1/glutamate synthase domain-containing protein 3
MYPDKEGLYDPRFEHSSCGVGFVADVMGKKSHNIVELGIQAIVNLNHRGACGCDPRTGDGAGILIQIPDEFFRKECSDANHIVGHEGFDLPPAGQYGVGMVFLPQIPTDRHICEGLLEEIIEAEGLELLGWRKVPVDESVIGEFAKDVAPRIMQVFVKGKGKLTDQDELERRLYVVRKLAQRTVREHLPRAYHYFYVPSFSSRTVVYKGMLICTQLKGFYLDLNDPAMKSALALVHQRYSTNTFPTWDLAQPFRFLGHNGEINTIWGNTNWMAARERQIGGKFFGEVPDKILPICKPMGSDSALLDSALEFLVLGGRSLSHAMMMLIPRAWENKPYIDADTRAFYDYHTSIMEPWDGPAAVGFTDGRQIGAVLDRNGLRPARYTVTSKGLVVMASETGVLDIPDEEVVTKGCVQPGKIFLVDVEEGRIIDDDEIHAGLARRKPYRQWCLDKKVRLSELTSPPPVQHPRQHTLREMQNLFGYTTEDVRMIMAPMASNGTEPIGSMGQDTPPAVLSDNPRLLFDYFRQRFAQVTNPPIDPIREETVMSTTVCVGGEGNLLEETAGHCHQIELPHPVLSTTELEQIQHYSVHHFRTVTIPILFRVEGEGEGLREALAEMCWLATEAVSAGYSLIILSDRHVNAYRAPIPSLLAVAALHQHLVREGTRTKVGIILESGEPREVHHFCLLSAYGASAVHPYLALETVADLAQANRLTAELSPAEAQKNYIASIRKGLLKVMSKMGISTLYSYHGAQIFEALGVAPEVVDEFFTGTPSHIGGSDVATIAQEAARRHYRALPAPPKPSPALVNRGTYQWRREGERHLLTPLVVEKLQQAVRTNSYETYQEYSRLLKENPNKPLSLRSLLHWNTEGTKSIPLTEVEPAKSIVTRFVTGAMSFGSLSREAHETLALAMNSLGGKSNSGEGGEDPDRFLPLPDGSSKRSAVKQIASGRFGVTAEYCVNADELQIKMAQGAKPGEGGHLPPHKVDEVIARTRYSTPSVGLISPPPHHDIYSIEDLAQLIFDLHCINPRARVSVKLVSATGVGTIAAGVAKAKADCILISGDSGGTGASPLSSIHHAGAPWELGLSEAHQVLVRNDLRGRVRLQVDGKLATGRDVAIAAMLGAEEFGFATLPLVCMGCVMMRNCHLNTCSVGIATQDPALRAKFAGKPEHVVNFFYFVAEELREIMALLGVRTVDDLVGRVDLLKPLATNHWKARHVDLTAVVHKQRAPRAMATRCISKQDHGLETSLDHRLLELAQPALKEKKRVQAVMPISNTNRTVGTMLSGEIARRYGHDGLPADTISFTFFGSAGQSFGAWGARGLSMEVVGDVNDYLGKGLSGARLVVRPSSKAQFVPEENIVVGNVALYGAIEGEVFIRGRAGERFCVRNSGAHVVVEGVSDHGCEYMTGGCVVVLGSTGRNFAAGMSGGVAYVWDPNHTFAEYCNRDMVGFETLDEGDAAFVRELVEKHVGYTRSTVAQRLLEDFEAALEHFVKVMPHDYKRVLGERQSSSGLRAKAKVA